MSLILGITCFSDTVYALSDFETDTQIAQEKQEIKYQEKAKSLLQNVSESAPLTIEGKEELMNYYVDTYIPKKGCDLVELPKDSDIHYQPPKPKPKPKLKPKPEVKTQTITQTKKRDSVKKYPAATISNRGAISMTAEERIWLEKLVQAEAGGESYEGKLAVATVIANRVQSAKFPNSVMGVIKANNGKFHQFQPWDDGRIYKVTPDANTKKAVAQVFDQGVRNLPKDAAYFAVKSIAFDNWMGKTRQHITTIGVHAFFSENPK